MTTVKAPVVGVAENDPPVHVDELEVRHYHLQFGIRRSVRYHDQRRAFYLFCHSSVTFTNMTLGSVTAILWNRYEEDFFPFAVVIPVIIAVLSAWDLVVGTTRKAALHTGLYRSFIRLEEQSIKITKPSKKALDDLETERLRIEMDEEPTYQALNRMCHNEQLRSEGRLEYMIPLTHWQAVLKNVCRFPDLADNRNAA